MTAYVTIPFLTHPVKWDEMGYFQRQRSTLRDLTNKDMKQNEAECEPLT